MSGTRAAGPGALAELERARSLANEACHMVALQRRRLRTTEQEDTAFALRRWADWQFFIVALRRLRQAASIAIFHPNVAAAVRDFDSALPALSTLRNVGEHIDDYASDRGRDRNVSRFQLQVGTFGADELEWLGHRLAADDAQRAAETLLQAVHGAVTA